MRKCVDCKVSKPANSDNFYKDKNRPLGLMYRCKLCDKKRTSSQDRSNRWSKMSISQKSNKQKKGLIYGRTKKGRAIGLWFAYKDVDLKKGRGFDISIEFIENSLNFDCVYCGFKSTGLDRIDNNIGHISENCVPACKECNVARNDNFTHDEMYLIGKVIRQIKMNRNTGL